VVDEILLRKPAGTATFGGLSEDATDSAGNTYTIYYSEPEEVPIHVALTLVAATDDTYVGDDAVADAIAEWATRSLRVGRDVYGSDIVGVVVGVEGVTNVDVSTVFVKDSDPPTGSTDQAITARQLGTIIAGNVDVTS
jgi:phage-related baseplate assembly protein